MEFRRDEHGALIRDAEGRPIRLTWEEQEAALWETARDGNGNPYHVRYHEDADRRRATIKIRNPKRPTEVAVINRQDFNPAVHELWPDEE